MGNFKNKIEQHKFEENPFEDEKVSQEWISSVENEKDMARDKQIYPRLYNWINSFSPKTVFEIGSGQGICFSKLGDFQGKYIGIEPSKMLTKRALQLYKNENNDFVIGNAYKLPLENECCDASFAINVWFHLENLDKAAAEIERVLKSDGKFMIITVNPAEYDGWMKSYDNIEEHGKKIIGKANTPITPLSRNTFYKHSMEEILNSFNKCGLIIKSVDEFDFGNGGPKYFMQILGKKGN